jgi:undecaprenyl-diphosphatase
VGDRFIAPGKKNEKTMTVVDALVIGVAQAFALIPGLSRSGSTITVGMSRGLNRDFAVRFSLLMSIPAILGSTVLSIFKALRAGIEWGLVPKYLVGALIAAVIGYFCIKLIHRLMRSGKFGKFAYYCWAVGFITIILSLILN